MNEVKCRPCWWGKDHPEIKDMSHYKATKVLKDTDDVENVFNQAYIDSLPEDWVWKIEIRNGFIWRSNEDFKEEFKILE